MKLFSNWTEEIALRFMLEWIHQFETYVFCGEFVKNLKTLYRNDVFSYREIVLGTQALALKSNLNIDKKSNILFVHNLIYYFRIGRLYQIDRWNNWKQYECQ